jgi:phosphonopyruvate decarboxylase
MIEPSEFIDALASNGYDVLSGVPCSNISTVFHALENTEQLLYVPATTEGEAVGIAAGSWLAGKKAAVICQNSGVGNMVNPLASLNAPYGIPTTLFVSMRGALGFPDEAQHEIMGSKTGELLKLLSVNTAMLTDNIKELNVALTQASAEALNRKSCAFLINPKVINNPKTVRPPHMQTSQWLPVPIRQESQGAIVSRRVAIDILMEAFKQYATIATTGYASRELWATGDRPNYFYMAGSMGHAAAIGLGVSLSTTRPTVVLDGDGALLMKMGVCATIGRQAPKNLIHIVLDNGLFESTGGQSSNSGSVDFSKIASASSYRQIWQCTGSDAIEKFSRNVDPTDGPTFAHIVISPSSELKAPRPNIDLRDMAARFRAQTTSQPA